MQLLRLISRYVIGFVFIVSGFLKAIDPVGTALKVQEYFHAFFRTDLTVRYAIVLGVVLCVAEFLTGVGILKVIKFRFFTALAFLMTLFFVLVTLISAITGKVADCGCFGEILHLDPWPSFYKNIVLLALCIILYRQRFKVSPIANSFWEWAFVAVYAVLIIGVSVYSVRNLPPSDFSDFRPGRSLLSEDSTQQIRYETEILYSKDGITKKFSLDNLPDSTWKYVETISTVLEGSEKLAKTMPFILKDGNGRNVTNEVLKSPKPLVFISFYNAENITDEGLDKLKNLCETLNDNTNTELIGSFYSYAYEADGLDGSVSSITAAYEASEDLESLVPHKYEVYVLSAMTPEETYKALRPVIEVSESEERAELFSSSHNRKDLPFNIVYSDFKTVITFNRSNGGATYINGGMIVKKWSALKYGNGKIVKTISQNPLLLAEGGEKVSRLFLIVSIAVIVGLVLVVRFISRAIYKNKVGI